MYDVIIGRHRHSSLIITSNRDVAEWVALFDGRIFDHSQSVVPAVALLLLAPSKR